MEVSSISGFALQPKVAMLKAQSTQNNAVQSTAENLNMLSTAALGRVQVAFKGLDKDFDKDVVQKFKKLAEGELDESEQQELLEMMDEERFSPNALCIRLNEPRGLTPVLELLFSSEQNTSAFVEKLALHPYFDFNNDHGWGKHKRVDILKKAMYGGKEKEFSALLENNPFVEIKLHDYLDTFNRHNNLIDYVRAHNAPYDNTNWAQVAKTLENYHFEGGREKALERYNEVNSKRPGFEPKIILDDLKPTPNELFAYELRKERPDPKKLAKLIDDEKFDVNMPCAMNKSAGSLSTPLQALFNFKDSGSFFLITKLVKKPGFNPNEPSLVVTLKLEKNKSFNTLEGAIRNKNNGKLKHLLDAALDSGVKINVTDVHVTNHKVRNTPNLIEFAKTSGNNEAMDILKKYAEKTGQI